MNKQVWCWGKNSLGQLGDGTTTDRAGAVRVIKLADGLPLQNATAVDASVGHSCAIVAKQVWCWGANFDGKLGDGTTTDRLGAVLVKKSDSTTLDNVTAIALGYHFSCAISNKQIWCWGNNQEGEIGDGTTTSATTGAVLADYGSTAFTNVTKISAGRKHVCAISDGKAYCWGTNDEGQLGIGTTAAYELYPAHVRAEGSSEALTGFTDIAAGWAHSCGVVNKYVYCWGWNTSGQLGVNDSGVHISARKSLKTDGTSYGNASRVVVGSPFSCVLEAKAVWCTGENTNGALATNTFTSSTVGVASQYRGGGFLTGVTDITTGLSHACAIIKKQAWCWGENDDGQLGDGTTEDRLGAVRVAFAESVTAVVRDVQPATAVSGGLNQSCAVVNKQAYCWGDNTNGELGNGGTTSYASARVVLTAAGAPLTNVTAVSSGYSHACAVANKQAYCWGDNSVGQLGDNTTTNRTGAVAVQTATGILTGVTAVSAGNSISCAIANKQAYCWGSNTAGQVGDGTNVSKQVATLVVNVVAPLSKVTAIAAGYDHACAVANKIAYCWGSNSVGQVGNNSLVNVALATEVQLDGGLLLDKATDVGVADGNSCAINNKQVYCWGDNGNGQVGDGTTINRSVATRVMVDATTPLGVATQLGVGGYHACALVNKQAWCWGENNDGQLGDGNSGTNSVYAVIANYLVGGPMTGVTQVKAGYYHTCAIIAKQVWCWGSGSAYALGDEWGVMRKGAVKSLFHRILLTQLKGL